MNAYKFLTRRFHDIDKGELLAALIDEGQTQEYAERWVRNFTSPVFRIAHVVSSAIFYDESGSLDFKAMKIMPTKKNPPREVRLRGY